MKLLVIGILLFLGYRLIIPPKKIESTEDLDQNDLDDGEFTDYEEVD